MAYLPLSTANLPDPAINPAQGSSPEDYFNTVTYAGTGSTQSITGVGHQPDMVWIKERNNVRYHRILDVVRGATKEVYPNATDAEATSPNSLTSFDSDGFTIGSDTSVNNGSGTYVAWNWKANGSGVTNTDGDIATNVSVNTESGFSIVSYTCPATTVTGDTIGHGLGVAPEFAIFRNRDFATDWGVYHKDLGNTHGILLNSTGASFSSTEWWNNTSPTSTEMSLGRFSYIQRNSDDYIAYCFHSVEGFSKFSSYVGNNAYPNAGPFVYTGFRPAWIMIKGTASGRVWMMYDNERLGYNIDNNDLRAEQSGTEGTGDNIALLSNGFQIVNQSSNGQVNGSGETYIYMAFAENPFKYSNAR